MPFDVSLHAGLTSEEAVLVQQTSAFAQHYFQDPKFDASHDFNHVLRVTAIATKILDREQADRSNSAHHPPYNALLVILGALLHDVDDKKYVDVSAVGFVPRAQQKLIDLGASAALASKTQTLIDAVSYSSEVKNPQKVQDLLRTIPELAIVQDADRLDAIGAVGIGRCFTFGGAKGARSMGSSIEHFDEKLIKLESMMKTTTGKQLAAVYTSRLKQFKSWWAEELMFAEIEP